MGLKVVEVPSIEFLRKHGKSNLSILRDGLRILWMVIEDSQTLWVNSLMRVHDFERSDFWGGYRC